ncbi:MAG: hypothetical protein CSA38_02170 [Flavobacteriales bacterium]|nr:MAG: hypothetical protein CSA38_02170 [Flavobacteriales bacterium]
MKIIFFLFCTIIYGQNSVELKYELLDKFENADLNYKGIDSIDSSTKGIAMLDSVFNVVEGKYFVYRYITKDRGLLFDEYKSNLNNLIILKVDSKGIIVDGYKYLLQNPEMPSKCYLYRITKKKKLKSKINISTLRFKRVLVGEFQSFKVCEGIPLFLKDKNVLERW